MKRLTFAAAMPALAMLALAGATGRVQAQSATPKSALFVSPYAGYMVFGDRLKGPLGTYLSNKNSPVFGAQAGIGITKNVSLVGNVGYAKTNWTVGAPILGSVSVANANVWMYDAGLEYRMPLSGLESAPLTPVFQLGAGAVRYSVGALPIDLPVIGNLLPLSVSSTNFAANAGVGVDYKVTPSLGVRLLAKDYVGKFDVGALSALGVDSKLSHNLALSVGVNLGF
jgi:hypothetical protein